MKYSDAVEHILNFEEQNISSLMSFKARGVCFYPCIRTRLLRNLRYSLLSPEYKETIKYGFKQRSHFLNSRKVRYFLNKILLKGLRRNNKLERNIYFITKNRARRIKKLIGYQHRSVDILRKAFGKKECLTYELVTVDDFRFPSRSLPDFYPYQTNFSLKSISRQEKKAIERFLVELEAKLNSHFEMITVETINRKALEKIIKRALVGKDRYKKLFKKHKPQLLILDDACYGENNIALIKAAKEQSILTCEYQHGVVARSHLAYNYKADKEYYEDYLPDVFFTYGKHWQDQLNRLPIKKIISGYIHHQYLEKLSTKSSKKKNSLLLICGEYEKLIEVFLLALKHVKVDQGAVVKLHPNFSNINLNLLNLAAKYNVKMTVNADVYSLIRESEIVICEYSTAAFESTYFKDIKLLIYQSELSESHVPKILGTWFKDEMELADLIKNQDDLKSFSYRRKVFFEPLDLDSVSSVSRLKKTNKIN